MRIFAPVLILVFLAGCVHTASESPRLASKKVLEIAAVEARMAGNNLSEYQTPSVTFDSKEKQWSVYWDRKPPGFPGGYICIYVDDKTGDAKLIPSD